MRSGCHRLCAALSLIFDLRKGDKGNSVWRLSPLMQQQFFYSQTLPDGFIWQSLWIKLKRLLFSLNVPYISQMSTAHAAQAWGWEALTAGNLPPAPSLRLLEGFLKEIKILLDFCSSLFPASTSSEETLKQHVSTFFASGNSKVLSAGVSDSVLLTHIYPGKRDGADGPLFSHVVPQTH